MTFILFLIVIGLSGNSASAASAEQPSPNGAFITGCNALEGTRNQYYFGQISFYGKRNEIITVTKFVTTDAQCQDPAQKLLSQVSMARVKNAEKSSDSYSYKVDLEIIKQQFLLHTEGAASDWNRRRACGLQGWQAGVPKDPLKEGSTEAACIKNLAGLLRAFDIFIFEEKKLKVGLKSSVGPLGHIQINGYTDATRTQRYGKTLFLRSSANSIVAPIPTLTNNEDKLLYYSQKYCTTCHYPNAKIGDLTKIESWQGQSNFSKQELIKALESGFMPKTALEFHPIDTDFGVGTSDRVKIIELVKKTP